MSDRILPKGIPRDTFFDLSLHGKLPEILRAIADRIQAGEVNAENFNSEVTRDHIDLTIRLDLNPGGPR